MQWKSTILTNQASKIYLNLSELIQKDLDCNLGTRNTVWRRLRRAKKGLLIKNKFLENWIAPAYMGLICGFGQKRGLYDAPQEGAHGNQWKSYKSMCSRRVFRYVGEHDKLIQSASKFGFP